MNITNLQNNSNIFGRSFMQNHTVNAVTHSANFDNPASLDEVVFCTESPPLPNVPTDSNFSGQQFVDRALTLNSIPQFSLSLTYPTTSVTHNPPALTPGTILPAQKSLSTSSPPIRSSTDVVTPKMELVNEELWSQFHQNINEMVVCRDGRKIFPKIKVRISGLNPTMNYFIVLFMKLVDRNRYKFQGGSWSTSGHDNVPDQSNIVTHQDCINAKGDFLMRDVITFDRVKLTNRPKGEGSMIALSSMHKYQPVMQLFTCSSNETNEPLVTLEPPVMQFIAVTAYQNDMIKLLKVAHNPFAKGFREGSARKRSSSPIGDETFAASKRCDPYVPPLSSATAMLPLLPANSMGFPPSLDFGQLQFSSFGQQFHYNNNISAALNMCNANPNAMFGQNISANYGNALYGINNFSYQNPVLNANFPGFPGLVNKAGQMPVSFSPSAAVLASMLAQNSNLSIPTRNSNGSSNNTSISPSSTEHDENSTEKDEKC